MVTAKMFSRAKQTLFGGDSSNRNSKSNGRTNNNTSTESKRHSYGCSSGGTANLSSSSFGNTINSNHDDEIRSCKVARLIAEARWDDVWLHIVKHGPSTTSNSKSKGTKSGKHVQFGDEEYSNGNLLHVICQTISSRQSQEEQSQSQEGDASSMSSNNRSSRSSRKAIEKEKIKNKIKVKDKINQEKSLKLVKGLLSLFPLLDIQLNSQRQTPLHVAASIRTSASSVSESCSTTQHTRTLEQHMQGASADASPPPCSFSARLIATLLKYGSSSSPNIMVDLDGRTPLHLYLLHNSGGVWNVDTGKRQTRRLHTKEQECRIDIRVLRWLSEAGPGSLSMKDKNQQCPKEMIRELAYMRTAIRCSLSQAADTYTNPITDGILGAVMKIERLGAIVGGPLNKPSTAASRQHNNDHSVVVTTTTGYASFESFKSWHGSSSSSTCAGRGLESTASDGALVNVKMKVYKSRGSSKVSFMDSFAIASNKSSNSIITAGSNRNRRRGSADLAFAAAEASCLVYDHVRQSSSSSSSSSHADVNVNSAGGSASSSCSYLQLPPVDEQPTRPCEASSASDEHKQPHQSKTQSSQDTMLCMAMFPPSATSASAKLFQPQEIVEPWRSSSTSSSPPAAAAVGATHENVSPYAKDLLLFKEQELDCMDKDMMGTNMNTSPRLPPTATALRKGIFKPSSFTSRSA
jgi:hypothetical protein